MFYCANHSESYGMRKSSGYKNDRLPSHKKNLLTSETRERVVEGLVASATADFVVLVDWLKYGRGKGEPIPVAKCESLRERISHLQTLKSGVQTDWKNVLKLMEDTIHKSHKVKEIAPPPSKIVTSVLSKLNVISLDVASGKATPDMLASLQTMLQLISSLKGSEDLKNSVGLVMEDTIRALRGYKRQQAKPKLRKAVNPTDSQRDENIFRSECEPLIGLSDVFIIADCVIAMSARLGCSPISFIKRAAAMKGVIDPVILPELLELLQQDDELTRMVVPIKITDDNTRSDGGKLVGLTGIVEGGAAIGVEAQRLITKELRKHPSLTAAQQVSFDTARASLALESDPFKVIEEVKRIAIGLNWSPLTVTAYAVHKFPRIRPDIAGDVITLLAQDELLTENGKGR